MGLPRHDWGTRLDSSRIPFGPVFVWGSGPPFVGGLKGKPIEKRQPKNRCALFGDPNPKRPTQISVVFGRLKNGLPNPTKGSKSFSIAGELG